MLLFFSMSANASACGEEKSTITSLDHNLSTYLHEGFKYVEHGSKTFQGGFNQVHLPSKSVTIYRDENAGPRCLYTLLTLYLKRLPSDNEKINGIFYLKPLVPHPTKPWFANIPVGRNKLNTMVKRMCEAVGLPPRTNHSLRVTKSTTLFSKNISKKLVQEVTGHRSLECLRRYEKSTEQDQRAASKCNVTSGSQFKALTESQPSLECSSTCSSTELCPSMQPTINHLVNSSTAQPVHSGIPIAIPNYGTIRSVVINVYNNNSDSKYLQHYSCVHKYSNITVLWTSMYTVNMDYCVPSLIILFVM